MTHTLGTVGLLLNAVGALLLLWFPPAVTAFTADGREGVIFVNDVNPDAWVRYRRRRRGFRIAIAALVIGFVLQLIDLHSS
jgi:hypothetical protein